MVRQVCKKQEQVLSFVVSPGCFCLSFCFRVLFCFKPEKRVPPFHNPKEFRADDHYFKKKWVVRHQSQRGVVVAQQA